MAFLHGEIMGACTEQPGKENSQQGGEPKSAQRTRSQAKKRKTTKTPKKPGRLGAVSAQSLVKKAYRQVDKKLEKGDARAIDALAKLVKLEKDLGGEQSEAKEIKVRWEDRTNNSSSDE